MTLLLIHVCSESVREWVRILPYYYSEHSIPSQALCDHHAGTVALSHISSKNPRTFFCTCNWLHIYLWWKKFEHQNPEHSPAWSKLRRNVSCYKYGADWGSDHHQQAIQQSTCSNRKKRSFYFFLDYCNISSDQTLKQNGFLQSQQTVKLHPVHSWSMPSSLPGGCLISSTTGE